MQGMKSGLLLLLPPLALAGNHWNVTLSVGEGPGIASGIGIALFDSQGQQLPLNRPADRWISLYRGPTTLNFVAKYRATGRQVTGGAANAQAWFSLTYQ